MIPFTNLEFPINGHTLLGIVASGTCGVILGWYLCKKREPVTNASTSFETQNSDDALSSDSEEESAAIDLDTGDCYSSNGEFKMVIVVRQDLKMGKGKIAAQCSHAAVGAYKQLALKSRRLLRQWESTGQAKVVVKCQDETELLSLCNHANTLRVTATIIKDAGRTQIISGSRTVLGVGPGPVDLIDKITGHLKLL